MIKNHIVTLLSVSKLRFWKKNRYLVVIYDISIVFGEIFLFRNCLYQDNRTFIRLQKTASIRCF